MCQCSAEIKRQIGVLVDRGGDITHVIVGDPHAGAAGSGPPPRLPGGRLRGLRLLHTYLRAERCRAMISSTCQLLRLDLVAAIAMNPAASRRSCTWRIFCPKTPAASAMARAPRRRVTVRSRALMSSSAPSKRSTPCCRRRFHRR